MTTVLDHAPIARDGFKRLEPDITTSTDQAGHTGIDGIYYKDTPDGPHYQIVDQKHATNEHWRLGRVASGDTQLSPDWISNRLTKCFDPHRTGIDPTDQAHFDALSDYYQQVRSSPMSTPQSLDVSVHVQGVDTTGKVTDTTMKNTTDAGAVAKSSTQTTVSNETAKDQP